MKKVIIVDDEYFARLALIKSIAWQQYGFTVVAEAENGNEAYGLIRKMNPDLAIIDINMPFLDGLELLAKLNDKKIQTKFIVLSGYSEFEYAKKAIKYGVESYLLKPLIEEEMQVELTRIGALIDQEKKAREKESQYSKLAKDDFLRALFTGLMGDISKIEAFADFNQKTGTYKRTACISINYDEKTMACQFSDFSHDFVKIVNDCIRDEFIVEWCVLENEIAILISGGSQEILLEEEMRTLFSCINMKINALSFVERSYIGVSEVYSSLEHTPKEFQRARKENLQKCEVKIASKGFSSKEDFVGAVKMYVVDNIENMSFGIGKIVEKYHFSYHYTCRIFKKKTGTSLGDYILEVRMERAKQLIQEQDLRTVDLAPRCGYADPGYFSKVFKKYHGMTPKEMRKINR